MRRVVVLGPPGSGKSIFARRLGALRDLPVFHLDQAYWRPGWVEAPLAAFRTEVERLAALPEWVIDGNYTTTLGPRLAVADTVVVLDVPAWLSVVRVARRALQHAGRVRVDMAPGCPEQLDWAFLRFTWSWNRASRPRDLALVHGFAGRVAVLASRAAVRDFLAEAARAASAR